jgi:LPS sulfotransferase NodH
MIFRYVYDNGPLYPKRIKVLETQRSQELGQSIRGYKIHCGIFSQTGNKTYVRLLKKYNCKIIHLTRKNALDRLVSFKLASETGNWVTWAWESKEKQELYNNCQVTIPPHELFNDMRKSRRLSTIVTDTFTDIINVHYEDLKKDFNKIASWLDCTISNAPARTAKQRQQPKNKLIANYDELAKALREKDLDWMLQENL